MSPNDKKRLITRTGVRGNVRCITITDNVPEHWDPLLAIAKSSYDFWAYIYHDHDVDEAGAPISKHIHLFLLDKGGTTLKRHCERFSSVVPSNFIEKVWSPRAMARYLIHKDSPDKFQYDSSLVFTNKPDRFAGFLSDGSNDVVLEFRDFMKLYNGEVSVSEYLNKYRAEFSTMPFYQKQAFFHKIATSIPSLNRITSDDG